MDGCITPRDGMIVQTNWGSNVARGIPGGEGKRTVGGVPPLTFRHWSVNGRVLNVEAFQAR